MNSTRFRSIEDYDFRLAQTGCDFRIRAFLDARAGRKITRWVDVPSGVGVALHQGVEEYGPQIDAVGVDLILWDETNLSEMDMAELRRKYSVVQLERLLHKETFEFIPHDMRTVVIPDGADLITAMCGLYHHEDPIGVWKNLFDQLRLGGLLAAHFMFPKKNHTVIEHYKHLTVKLKSAAAAEIYFSDGDRDVCEAVIVTQKLKHDRLSLEAAVKSVEEGVYA